MANTEVSPSRIRTDASPPPSTGPDEPEGDSRHARVLGLINASWTTQAIAASVGLGIAELLARGVHGVEELAQASACHAPALRRLLSALESLQLVEGVDRDSFALTDAGELLCKDAEGSLACWAMFCGQNSWHAWAGLADSVRTGKSAKLRAGARDDFGALQTNIAAAQLFNHAMTNLTRPIAIAVAASVDFTEVDHVADIGGGHGELIATVLAAHPRLRGTLFDLEHAVSSAHATLERQRVAERCIAMCGSFFDAIPVHADMYLLKSILHDWDDEHGLVILQHCARAMALEPARQARLAIIERLRPGRFTASARDRAIARSDLNMLVSLGGRERTALEYQQLLAAAGLELTRVRTLPHAFSLLEATLADSST